MIKQRAFLDTLETELQVTNDMSKSIQYIRSLYRILPVTGKSKYTISIH